MPRGVYDKSRLWRKTEKLKGALTVLKTQDPYFQADPLMTNEDIFVKLKEFGFVYREGVWRMTLRPGVDNGRTTRTTRTTTKEVEHEEVVTIIPTSSNQIEMCVNEDNMEDLVPIVQAMHTLGFKVEIKITGKR